MRSRLHSTESPTPYSAARSARFFLSFADRPHARIGIIGANRRLQEMSYETFHANHFIVGDNRRARRNCIGWHRAIPLASSIPSGTIRAPRNTQVSGVQIKVPRHRSKDDGLYAAGL